MPEEKLTDTKIIRHRTNSIAQFIEAIKTEYIAGAEYDVVATSDNVPVLFHDRTITKGMSVPREVSKIPFAELKKILPDIETLEEALKAIDKENIRDDFEFHLEIKPDNSVFTTAVMQLMAKFPEIDSQTIPRSFQQNVLIQIKEQFPRDICLLLGKEGLVNPLTSFNTKNTKTYLPKLPLDVNVIEDICGGYRPEYVSVNYKMLTKEFINAMKAAEIQLDVYTLNDIAGLNGLVVDRVITDNPKEIFHKLN